MSSRSALPVVFAGGTSSGLVPMVVSCLKGALIGLGLTVAVSAFSQPIKNQLQFYALLLSKLIEFYPVGAAGVLIGGIIGLVWSRIRG